MNSQKIVSTTYFDLPLVVNDLIKEFLGWTENVRNSRIIEARTNLDRAISRTINDHSSNYSSYTDFSFPYQTLKSFKADRSIDWVAPNVQIGDEIYGKTPRTISQHASHGDFPVCGKVFKKYHDSIDVNVYGWIRDDFNSKDKKFIQYRWKKNVFYSSLYFHGEFQLNDDNNTGFKKRRLN